MPQPQVLQPAELDLRAERALEGRRVQAHGPRCGEGEEELQGRHEGRLEQGGRLLIWKDVRRPVRLPFLQRLDGGFQRGGRREEAQGGRAADDHFRGVGPEGVGYHLTVARDYIGVTPFRVSLQRKGRR